MTDLIRLPRTALWFIISALLLLMPGCTHAEQPGPLPVKKEKWSERVFPDRNLSVRKDKTETFHIENDRLLGPSLVIGPWLSGRWNAYYQYAGNFSLSRGTVRGHYRTEGLLPLEAAVFITYYKAGVRLDTNSFPLPPAREWTPFEVVARHPPPGTDAFSPGFGLRQKTEGRVFFTRMTVGADIPELQFPDTLPSVTRSRPADFEKKNFFSIARDVRNTWWLATPDGKPFYSAGTAGPGFDRTEYGYSRGHLYAEQVRSMGFNSLGGWTPLASWAGLNRIMEKGGKTPVPLFYAIESNKLKRNFDFLSGPGGKTCGGEGHEFPDPFDPAYAEAYRNHVEEVAGLIRGEKWFVGWFADNERDHTDLHRCVDSPYAKEAFMAWLKQRYGSIKALNKAWSTRFRSMEDAALDLPVPSARKGRIYEDFRSFARVIVSRYAELTLRTIRAADPDHLVFSPRFMLSDSSEWLSLLEHYRGFDGIAVNIYPSNRVPGLSESERLFLEDVHKKSGRPLIISEWSVPALDSGLYDGQDDLDWSFSRVVATQTERARQAALATVDFYNQPYIIGAHWFIWKDFDSRQRKANRGLFRADGGAWTELQQSLQKAHGILK